MQLLDWRLLGAVVDHLMRPDRAAQNARDAAVHAKDDVEHRKRIDGEVGALLEAPGAREP